MAFTRLIYLTIGYLYVAEARLISKITNSVQSQTDASVVNSTQWHRVTRDVYGETEPSGIWTYSIETQDHSPLETTRNEHILINSPKYTEKYSRKARKAGKQERETKVNDTQDAKRQPTTPKTKIAQKPLTNFNDVEYDEDAPADITKLSRNLPDSAEHEDEDFNVDDYEFDINHDEFSGQGKPLIPRRKLSETKQTSNKNSIVAMPEDLVKSMASAPKRQPVKKISSKIEKPKDDDDYDEATKKSRRIKTDVKKNPHEEDDDSSENVRVKAAVRAIRSSMHKDWLLGKLMEKYPIEKELETQSGLYPYKFFHVK